MKIFKLADIPIFSNDDDKCHFNDHYDMGLLLPKAKSVDIFLIYGGTPIFFSISLCKDCVKRYPSGKAKIIGKL